MAIVPELACDQVAPSVSIPLSAGPPQSDHHHHIADIVLTPYGRFWAVYEADVLVCVCVCKRGAAEVMRRLTQVAHGRAA
jgi:hypothetical protein